ncbi:protein CEBPZOS-like isoform X2 [Cimex lectularius]|uniref:Uncharacterized protein n=1 Tax=Cimex lectularius TaxID=79782 RepID=A0A8I6SIP5_CIMLE|nr:protein CEBPZOS-like isoform X2 [Cimex lectularius]
MMSWKDIKSGPLKYFVKGGKIILAAELACFVGTYLGWRQINHNQDLRFYLYQNQPLILEAYYKFGEQISSESKVREYDMTTWSNAGKLVRNEFCICTIA